MHPDSPSTTQRCRPSLGSTDGTQRRSAAKATLLAATLLLQGACAAAPRAPAESKPRDAARPRETAPSLSARAPSSPPEAREVTAGHRATSAPPPADATFGTAHPAIVAAASPDGTWVALCQAREDTDRDGNVAVVVGAQGELSGDELRGYFVAAPGEGELIDSFAGSDPSGRHVAFVRDGHLYLRDVAAGGLVDLTDRGADVRDDQSWYRHHRAISFDPTGRRTAYLRRANPGAQVVVRELASGAERTFEAGDGEVWRVDFDAAGERLLLRVATVDTNRNGKLDWWVHESRRQYMRCPPPIPRYPVWEYPGDRPTARLLDATTGDLTDAPDLVVPLASSLVERDATGGLYLRAPGGPRVLIQNDQCQGRLLHADFARELVLANCVQKNGRYAVRLLGRGFTLPLPLEMATAGSDHWFDGPTRLVPIHAGADTALLDLDRKSLEPLRQMDRVVATRTDRALVLRGSALVLHSLGGAEVTLSTRVDPFTPVLTAGRFVYMSPVLVDIEEGAVVGRFDADGQALSIDGRILRPTAPADAHSLAVGPFRWVPASHEDTALSGAD